MSALSRFVSPALVGLSLSFILSASLLLGLTGAATAQSLRDRDDLDTIRASTLGAYSFLDLAGAGDQLSNNTYRLLFSQPYDTYDWNIIESGYRLLLALTLDADHDGRAALLAAAVARNAGRPIMRARWRLRRWTCSTAPATSIWRRRSSGWLTTAAMRR